jgi:ribosome maturation protein Sdo1
MVNMKPGQTEVEAITEYLLEMGFHQITAEERKEDWYPAHARSMIRILANDDTSIPVPNEDERVRRWIAGEDDEEE